MHWQASCFFTFCVLFVLYENCGSMGVPASTIGPAPYPEWAHSHWVWLASSVANQTSETQLVLDYLARDVQVGGVDIDSQWATGDNNFVWDNEKYPDPKGMISNFHSLGVNVICWVTSVVNTDSSNYQEGLENNYFLNTSRGDGHVGLVNWWHGEGAFIDYTNPAALDWWHAQMDNVIDMGVDGWKCDGTDPYTFELYPIESYAGQITERDYANLYYGDFFNYTRTKNPNALIMSRPVDSYYVVYWSFSPHDVMYSGWVGDQDPTFDGLKDALRNMFHSAWRNYTNYGSDIGGYRSGNRTKDLFIRWAQLGAFCPLMENGGDGEHRPWMFDNTNQTLNIYRTFVDIHYELRPYFLNAGSTSMEEHIPVMYPQADRTLINPRNWAYLLWTDILVNPIVEDSTTVKIEFPSGNDWIDWWDSSITYQGGSTQHLEYPLELFPVFIRKGAMLALNVTKDLKLGHGDEFSAGRLTLFVPHAVEKGSQVVRRQNMISQEFEYIFNEEEKVFQFTATAHERKLLLVLHNVASAPTSIENIITSQKLTKYNSELEFRTAESGFYYNPLATVLIVKPCVSDNGTVLKINEFGYSFLPNA